MHQNIGLWSVKDIYIAKTKYFSDSNILEFHKFFIRLEGA